MTACFPCCARDESFTWLYGANLSHKLSPFQVWQRRKERAFCAGGFPAACHSCGLHVPEWGKKDCLQVCHPCSKVVSCAFFTLHFLHILHVICPLLVSDGRWSSSQLLKSSCARIPFLCFFYTFLEQKEIAEVKPSVFMWAANMPHEESPWQSLISWSMGSCHLCPCGSWMKQGCTGSLKLGQTIFPSVCRRPLWT